MKFQHNYLLNAVEMGVKYKNPKAVLMSMLMPAVIGGLGTVFGVSKLLALSGAIAKAFGADGDDPEEALYQWAEENMGKFAGETARHGLAGSVLGLSLKGSLAFNSPLSSGSIMDLGGAPVSVLLDEKDAIEHFAHGEIAKGWEKALPSSMGAFFKAYRQKQGLTTQKGTPKFFGPEQIRANRLESIITAMSFSPQRLASIQEQQWNERQVKTSYTEARTSIYRRYKNYMLKPWDKRNPEDLTKVINMMDEYNARVRVSNPKYQISYLTWPKIHRVLKQSTTAPKAERSRVIN